MTETRDMTANRVAAPARSTRSPLRAVLDAFGRGARSRADIVAATGLSEDTVDAAIEHLVRAGRITAATLSTACAPGGCGSCASGVDGQPGCGRTAPEPPARTGSRGALVQLSLRPPS